MRHDTLLLACGTRESRAELNAIFGEEYNILEGSTVSQAFLLLEQNRDCIAAVLLDLTAAGQGAAVMLERAEDYGLSTEVPFVVFVSDYAQAEEAHAFELGVSDVIVMPEERVVVHNRVNTIIELNRHKWHLEDLLAERTEMLRRSNETMVDALSSIIEYRDLESGQHILRIRRFTQILLEKLKETCPEYGLTNNLIDTISSAAALHDIGKIGIPDAILNKRGPLTPEERLVMQEHSLIGCRILESLRSDANREYLHYAHNICHYHHERWDGKGYPEGLSGEEIPICAQVVGLTDAYDALTSVRVYKDACPHEQAVNMILNGECGAFSPKLLECFKRVMGQFAHLAQIYADGFSPKAEDIALPLPDLSRPVEEDVLQTLQLKYQALLHYLGATVIEVNLDQDIFHLVYNPDPTIRYRGEQEASSGLSGLLAYSAGGPEEEQMLREEFERNMTHFLECGLRRHSYRCTPFTPTGSTQQQCSEAVFLRADPDGRKFIVLWHKCAMPDEEERMPQSKAQDEGRNDSVFDSFAAVYRCRNDRLQTFCSFGDGFSVMLGYTPEEIREELGNNLFALIPEEEHERIINERFQRLTVSPSVELEFHMYHKSGHLLRVVNRIQLVVEADGQEYLYGVLLDVTDGRAAQKDLYITHELHQIILDQTESVIFEWDVERDSVRYSSRWMDIFGYEPLRQQISTSLEISSHIHPADIPLFWNRMRALKAGSTYQIAEVRIAKADGRYMWCRVRATGMRNAAGNVHRVVGLITNIDEEQRTTESLLKQAEQDPLTKLLNKEAGRKNAEGYLSAGGKQPRAALLIIDLDNFKTINDRYGHLFGDAVLTRVATELQESFRANDVVARIGGDEFMVLMKGNPSRKLVQERCARLVKRFYEILRDLAPDCPASCSVGIVMTAENSATYNDLFQKADKALYVAKRNKNTFVFYDGEDPSFQGVVNPPSVAVTHIDSNEQPAKTQDDSLIRYAFQRLYRSSNLEDAIQAILEAMGRQVNASRVYIFENNADNTLCFNTFEWCNEGVVPEIDNLQGVSYETDIPGYDRNFNEQGIFYVTNVNQLPENLYDILAPQGIISMLQCAIYDNGVFRGYVGFDECTSQRLWTHEQIEMLSFCAEILSVFLLKKRAQDNTARYANDLTSVLDNQNAWIYVIDPQDCTLHYLNAKTRALAPAAQTGMKCYECLQNRDARCPNCPAEDIRQRQNAQVVFNNEYLGKQVVAEASLIQWEGKDACLLTCRDVNNSPL